MNVKLIICKSNLAEISGDISDHKNIHNPTIFTDLQERQTATI